MTFDIDRKTTFDRVAELYDEARPGYPEQLFDDIILLSRIADGGRLLEIGCGTGKATLPFAERGYAMQCLELGKNLAALAAQNCRAYPHVEIKQTSFEDRQIERDSFDLVFSAQAFHWIPIEIAYAKSAAALKLGGHLALFWNTYPAEDAPMRHDLDEIYLRHALKSPIVARYVQWRRSVLKSAGSSMTPAASAQSRFGNTHGWKSTRQTVTSIS